jgi:hypothetical protein
MDAAQLTAPKPLLDGAAHGAAAAPAAPRVSAPSGIPPHSSILPPAVEIPSVEHEAMIREAVRRLLEGDAEFEHYRSNTSLIRSHGLLDFLFAAEDDPHDPDLVFSRLRWGGQFVYLTRHRARLANMADRFAQRGYEVVHGPTYYRTGPLRHLPFLGRRVHYLIARKIYLTRPREITERFTYHVQLAPPGPSMGTLATNGHVVLKEVPSFERIMGRLRAKFTDVPANVLERRALKFTEKVFPLFLTREAAMLMILQRDLPPQYARRVPTLIEAEKDARGYVRRMWMKWLRNGGRTLTQMEFAKQSADLLRVVHEAARIIHLDLRLDNFVITENGVGFVDFGSAVRVGENIQGNPMLSTLFEELMRTSQIQRMLYKMASNGSLTSYIITDAYGKVDKAVDLFYLAVQMRQPTGNPDLAGLIRFNPGSEEAIQLAQLSQEILKPGDPSRPKYRTATDVLTGLHRIEQSLRMRHPAQTANIVIEKIG